jgi:hypothetical protein
MVRNATCDNNLGGGRLTALAKTCLESRRAPISRTVTCDRKLCCLCTVLDEHQGVGHFCCYATWRSTWLRESSSYLSFESGLVFPLSLSVSLCVSLSLCLSLSAARVPLSVCVSLCVCFSLCTQHPHAPTVHQAEQCLK